MKKRLKKRFNSIVLCMTLLFTTIVSPVIAHAIEDTNIPKQAGKVFAGYYKDADCTQPVYEGEQVTTKYEKFVDENVLSVKCQITAGTKVTSSSTDLRLVTTVDSLNYQEVGFKIKAEGKTNEMTLSSKLVYTSISAFVKEDKTVYTPKEFSTESNFFMADKVLGILNNAFSVTFTATPYWITLDGTTVTGTPKSFTINDGVDKGSVYGDGIKITPEKKNQQAVFSVTEKKVAEGEDAGKTYTCIENITTQGFSMLTIAATEAAGLVPNTECTVTVDVVLTYTGSSSSFPAYFDYATNDFIIKSDNSGGPITFTITTDENGAFTKTWESVYINTCDMTVSFTDLKIVPSN